MLENMKDMLEKAKSGKYAVPHFNINNLEWARFILEECQNNYSPVILGVSEGAIKYMGGYNVVASMIKALINDLNITVPVSLHLDHGSSYESVERAINAGFTSVMIDASKLELEKNIEVTKKVVEYARKFNVTVEAEVGAVGGSEDGVANIMAYAKIDDCIKLVNETKIDFLAPALGSVHGLYKGEPKLDMERMKEISDKTNLPLVLHGGTGIYDNLIKESISNGICKININTELQIAWTNGVREFIKSNDKEYDPRKIIKSGESSMKQAIKSKIILFGSNGKV